MTGERKLIALISATQAAIGPATAGLLNEFGEVTVWNLLDDRLLADAAAEGLNRPLSERMRQLIDHAIIGGADGVLLTCSMYGPVAQQFVASVPVHSADEAAFMEAASGHHRRVLVVASIESALVDSMERFRTAADGSGHEIDVSGLVVPAAFDAANAGDHEALVAALANACRPELENTDAILLAQYSLAPAQAGLSEQLGRPVISGPQAAAARLKLAVTEPRSGGTLGAIADDYTGGTDVALAFRQAGLQTLLFFGNPEPDVELPSHDAIVIALKSRTIPPNEAVEASLQAATWLEHHGVGQLFFKYCSTFDSTPEGNIGPVLDALSEATGSSTVLTTPSTPEHLRTVYAGQLFVDQVLLAESHMSRHPLTPMTDSYLPRVLRAQSKYDVAHLSLPTIRAGVTAIQEVASEVGADTIRFLLADSVDDVDLQILAHAFCDSPLMAGAAGLASALALARVAGQRHNARAANDPIGHARSAVLSGSCSVRTLEQIAEFSARGNPSFRVDALTASSAAELATHALTWFDSLPPQTTPLIYSSLPFEELRRVQHELGTIASAELLENALSRIAVGLAKRGVRRFIIAGGETSGAILDALEVDGATVGPDVSAGVPWIITLGDNPLALLLKSGNFGDLALFSRAIDPDTDWGVRS